MAKLCRIAVMLLAVCLAACSTVEPIEHDQSLSLQGNEGLLGVVVDTADTVQWVRIVSADSSAKTMIIPVASPGQTLYLFKAKAGDYCFDGLEADGVEYKEDWGSGMCFTVPTGAIAYGGRLLPLKISSEAYQFHVIYDPPLFESMLKKQYPDIAAKYLPSFKPSPPLHSICNPQQETCD